MARKKKTKKVEVVEKNSIAYEGVVTIKTIKNGKVTSEKKYHNRGTKQLFNFLLDCLAGSYITENQPRFLATALKDSTNNTYKYISNNIQEVIQIKSYTQDDNNDNYVEYKFLLPYKNEYKATGYNALIVFNKKNKPTSVKTNDSVDTNSCSMILDFSEKQTADIDENTFIVWQLMIDNKTISASVSATSS
jgi:hypothetical protein